MPGVLRVNAPSTLPIIPVVLLLLHGVAWWCQSLHLKGSLAKFSAEENSLALLCFQIGKRHLENSCYTTTLGNVVYNETIKDTAFFHLAIVSVNTFLWQVFFSEAAMTEIDGGGDLEKGSVCFCGVKKAIKEEGWAKVTWLDVLQWMSPHIVCHLYREKEAQQEISSYLEHKREEENVKLKDAFWRTLWKKISSTNFSGQIKQNQPIYPSITDKLLLKKMQFVNKDLPHAFTVLLSVFRTKSLKSHEGSLFFPHLLYRGQRSILHSEKWLLLHVYISKVIAAVTTKSCQLF